MAHNYRRRSQGQRDCCFVHMNFARSTFVVDLAKALFPYRSCYHYKVLFPPINKIISKCADKETINNVREDKEKKKMNTFIKS